MTFQSDNWTMPFVVGNEDGYDYADIGEGVRLFDLRYMFTDEFGDGAVEKIGYAVHHDAIAMAPGDMSRDIARLRAIHTHHTVTNGWGGIGYHRVISPSGRVFLVGGSASQRAHVKGLNHFWIGYCLMGDFSVNPPTNEQRHALIQATQWETNMRGVSMQVAPHKRLNLDDTACPGGWAAVSAWEGLTLHPQAIPPPSGPSGEQMARQYLTEAATTLLTANADARRLIERAEEALK